MNTKPILLVEDDRDIRENLRMFLELENFTVHAVANGREALDFLKTGHSARMILLDLMMPVMDGHEFLERYFSPEFEALEKIPVILLSAAPNLEKTARSRQLAFVKKPIDLDLLLSAMQKNE